jgi:agmatinase
VVAGTIEPARERREPAGMSDSRPIEPQAFEHLPLKPAATDWLGSAAGTDRAAPRVALLGVPFDGLTTEGRGQAEGPAAVREALARVGTYSVRAGRPLAGRTRTVDAGDVNLPEAGGEASFEPIHRCIEAIAARGLAPLLVGGDHSLTYPAVSAMASHRPHLRLVQIDAHFDATDPAEWHCRYNHGTFVRNLIDDGVVAGDDVFGAGMRDFQWRPGGAAFAAERGVRTLTMHDYGRAGAAAWVGALAAEPGPTWVTVDLDAVDPAFAPGVGEHMPGGFSSREAIDLLAGVLAAAGPIVGGDVVEVCPGTDPQGVTASLAAHFVTMIMEAMVAGPAPAADLQSERHRGS